MLHTSMYNFSILASVKTKIAPWINLLYMEKRLKKTIIAFLPLIEEIPTHSKPDDAAIEGIMGSQEVVFDTNVGIDMAHHDEEPRVLEVEVGINVDDRTITYFHP